MRRRRPQTGGPSICMRSAPSVGRSPTSQRMCWETPPCGSAGRVASASMPAMLRCPAAARLARPRLTISSPTQSSPAQGSPTQGSPTARHAPQGGVHPIEWGCELLGTAILLVGGLSAICLDFGAHGPIAAHVASHSLRLLITGLLFAGTGSLVAISPLGRRSGAHLNPVVTMAFWLRGNVHPHD